jgi:hypothetical protein
MTDLAEAGARVQLFAPIDNDHYLAVLVPDETATRSEVNSLLLYVVPLYDASATAEPYYFEPTGLPESPLEAYLEASSDRGLALRQAVKGRTELSDVAFAAASESGYFHTIHGALLRYPEKYTGGRTQRYLWLPRLEDYRLGESVLLQSVGIMGLSIDPVSYQLYLERPMSQYA